MSQIFLGCFVFFKELTSFIDNSINECWYIIYLSETIGKADAPRQSEAITLVGHTNNVVSQSKLYAQIRVFFYVSI
jgi:hypothetical protein